MVGAGPTGLLLTTMLRRLGVDAHVVDRNSAPLTWDRATVITARTLEILDQFDVAAPIVSRAVPIRELIVSVDGALLSENDIGNPGAPYPFNVGLSEEHLEHALRTDLGQRGGVVHGGTTLRHVRQGVDDVEVTLDRRGASSTVHARWLVGCDGFHGATRNAAGIARRRLHPDRNWAVFDAAVEPWTSSVEATYGYLDGPGAVLTPLPDRRWRVYTRPAAGADVIADALSVLRRYHPSVRFADVADLSEFTCHSMIAAQYRSGRVLLAGDAAHVCSPAQGQGMNIGVHDAHNLGWKLAMVLRGGADDRLLDSYSAERRPIGEAVIHAGDAVDRAADGKGRAADPERLAELGRVLAVDDDEPTWIVDYPTSPIVIDRGGVGVPPGAVAPPSWSSSELRHRLVMTASSPVARRHHRRLDAATRELGWSPLHAAIDGRATTPTLHVIRPDGHVGLRAELDDERALEDYLTELMGSAGRALLRRL